MRQRGVLVSWLGFGAGVAMTVVGCGGADAVGLGNSAGHASGGASGALDGGAGAESDAASSGGSPGTGGRAGTGGARPGTGGAGGSTLGAGGAAGDGGTALPIPCNNSLDCPSGLVCTGRNGACVQCATNLDCGANEACVGYVCREPCASDKECRALGQLCNAVIGRCVDCLVHSDCPDSKYCGSGTCFPDLCVAGSSACQGNATVTCGANGEGFGASKPCASRATCIASGGSAECKPWVCSAGLVECDAAGTSVVTCAADGLSVVDSVDCTASGLVCSQATCKKLVCSPGVARCDGNTVRRCSSDGLSEPVTATCTSTQYCDPKAALGPACVAQVCTPGQPACNGSVATTCNATGSGYVPKASDVDCATLTQSCVSGACTAKSTVNVVGSPTSPFTGATRVRLNYFSVTSSHTLTRIEAYLDVTVATSITWVVYDATAQTGTYTLVSQSTSNVAVATGYAGSGALSVPLVAGHYYGIGFAIGAQSVTYYDGSAGPIATGFGQTVASELMDGIYPAPASFTYGQYLSSANVYAERLTTTP